MNSKYVQHSLKQIINDLTLEFDGIRKVYIFGSRRHRTMSTRSDLDLLLTASANVRPDDVRDFAIRECKALDFFFMERGSARSCDNGSRVRAKSDNDLIYKLDALEIWDNRSGFTNADIAWEFEVIRGQEPVMTTLISANPFPSKSEAIASNEATISEAGGRSKFKDLLFSRLSTAFIAGIAGVTITFNAIEQTRIIPLKEENERLEKQIVDLNKAIDDENGEDEADGVGQHTGRPNATEVTP